MAPLRHSQDCQLVQILKCATHLAIYLVFLLLILVIFAATKKSIKKIKGILNLAVIHCEL